MEQILQTVCTLIWSKRSTMQQLRDCHQCTRWQLDHNVNDQNRIELQYIDGTYKCIKKQQYVCHIKLHYVNNSCTSAILSYITLGDTDAILQTTEYLFQHLATICSHSLKPPAFKIDSIRTEPHP